MRTVVGWKTFSRATGTTVHKNESRRASTSDRSGTTQTKAKHTLPLLTRIGLRVSLYGKNRLRRPL